MNAPFILGQLVATAAVAAQMREEPAFDSFVRKCLSRYLRADWGEMAEEDMDAIMQAMQEAYWEAKKNNRKYVAKQFREDDAGKTD